MGREVSSSTWHQGMGVRRGKLVDELGSFHLPFFLSWLDGSLWSWRRLLISRRRWTGLIFSQPSSRLEIKSLGTLLIGFLLNKDNLMRNEECERYQYLGKKCPVGNSRFP